MRIKKSKIYYVMAGGVIVLTVIIIGTIFFCTSGQKIRSTELNDEKIKVLKIGEICHFIEEEKQSIPYRWQYYISDESLMGVYSDEYKSGGGIISAPGSVKGWRRLYFEALMPGECMITLRYEDVRDGEYSREYIYSIVIADE